MPPPELSIFMRNTGSSAGTSLATTLIARRSQFHREILGDYIRSGNSHFRNTVTGLTRYLTNSGVRGPDAQKHAHARIYQLVQAQAASLAYVDTFMVLAIGSAIMFFLAFILKKNSPGGGGDLVVE